MNKQIIFCADGTRNDSRKNESKDIITNHTNVYNLFICLQGEPAPDCSNFDAKQENAYSSGGESMRLSAFILNRFP